MKKRSELVDLIQNDPFDLLKSDYVKKGISENDSALINSFEEIQSFIEEHNCEPQSNLSNMIEFKLFARLKAIRSDAKKIKILSKYDFGGLLKGNDIKEITIEDIISDDSNKLLGEEEDSEIFKLKHVKSIERIKPDYLSRRKVCKDFSLYKEMFNILHEELATKKRRLIKYTSSDLNAGNFYALDGIIFYLKSIEGDTNKYVFNSGERERFDGRTLCVFDNGTQSDMLFRSLDKAMQLDGYSISASINDTSINLTAEGESDVLNGYIYVLASKNPDVKDFANLYKIGHTTGSVADRIKNAKKEATYLFNDVDIISTHRCLNIQSYNLEQTIHDFFSAVKLDIELFDNRNNIYKPREWFKVSHDVVKDAINLIVSNQINDYLYDPAVNQVIKKFLSQEDSPPRLAAEDSSEYRKRRKNKEK